MKFSTFVNSFNFKETIPHFINCTKVIRDTIPFVLKHKLWKGFFDYKWVLFLSIVISILFSYFVYQDFISTMFIEKELDVVMQSGLGVDVEELVNEVKNEGKKGAYSSGTKYLLLILLEVVIFHFSIKTLSILAENREQPKFKDFLNAEKRMIKLLIMNYIKGLIALGVITIGLSMLGFEGWTSFFMFFIYAYFVGHAFLDNYNEQFKKSMKISDSIIKQHIGASLALGILISVLLFIPLLGPLFAPILGAIAAAIYGERYKIENSVPQEVFAIDDTLV